VLQDLLRELSEYPAPRTDVLKAPRPDGECESLVTPMNIVVDGMTLAFFSTTAIFGTPVDITLSEIAIESFFPADAATAEAVARIAGSKG